MSELGRYRKVYVRLWLEPAFAALADAEKLLAIYLLTGPQTNRLGFYVFSLALAAEHLGTARGRLQRRLTTVCERFGWSYDAASRVVFIPSWFTWNPPDSPKTMKGFLRDLEEVPVSTLREAFVRAVETLGFGEDIWKGMRKGIGNPIGEGAAYQDQDQHRQQQQGSETHTPTVPPASGNVASQHERFERFWTAYPKKVAKDAAWKAWRQRNPNQELTEEMLAAVEWQRTQDDWRRDGGRYIPKPATWLTDGRWQDQPRSTPRVSDRNLAIAGAVKEFAGHD